MANTKNERHHKTLICIVVGKTVKVIAAVAFYNPTFKLVNYWKFPLGKPENNF